MTALEQVKHIIEALQERKGQEIEVLKVEQLTTLTEYFVFCSATSTTQVKALADSVALSRRSGFYWTSARWSCISSCPNRGSFTTWKTCGRTASRWRFPSWV